MICAGTLSVAVVSSRRSTTPPALLLDPVTSDPVAGVNAALSLLGDAENRVRQITVALAPDGCVATELQPFTAVPDCAKEIAAPGGAAPLAEVTVAIRVTGWPATMFFGVTW